MSIFADPQEVVVEVDGQTPPGALFVSVKNTGGADATFNGVTLLAGEVRSYPFVGKGYRALSYVTNGTTLQLLVVL